MTNLNEHFSIFKKLRLPETDIIWISWLSSKSKIYEEFGSFMDAQNELFSNIYDYLSNPKSMISVFIAPPASGKTHVISLLCYFLKKSGLKSCVVVPNGELKKDFVEHQNKIKTSKTFSPEVLTLSNYIKVKSKFDIVLIDEAHNLQSAFNFNPDIVKIFTLQNGDVGFEYILERYLQNKDYAMKTLSLESSNELLDILSKKLLYFKITQELKKSLSNWIGFLFVTKNECKIKFIVANPEIRSILPNGPMMLFSATPLGAKDLEFYCNIPTKNAQYYITKLKRSTPNPNVHNFALNDKINFNEKTELIISILSHVKEKSLVLLNNSEGCENWTSILRQHIAKNRIYSITSGLDLDERLKIYDEFTNNPEGILLSSSSVFWEGITIKNLKLLLIPEKPFPEPNILDVYYKRKFSQQKIIDRRLIQGLGRINRMPNQKSVGILFFNHTGLTNVEVIKSNDLLEILENYI